MSDIISMNLCIVYDILHEIHLHLYSVHIYCVCNVCNDDVSRKLTTLYYIS